MKRRRRERTQLISRLKFSGASRSTNRAGQKGSLCFSQKIIKRVMVQQGEPWLHTECRSCQLYAITARSPPFPPRFCIPVFFSFPPPSPFSLPSASFPPFFPSFLPFFHSFPSFLPFFFPLPFNAPPGGGDAPLPTRPILYTLYIYPPFSFSEDGDCRRSAFYCPSVPCRNAAPRKT